MKTKTLKTKNKTARAIFPPPPGWEIVGKDDPRLKKLPATPMVYDERNFPLEWKITRYKPGDRINDNIIKWFDYALPIATQSATPPAPPPPMIRLRLPSEKPTREDADDNGCIVVIWEKGQYDLRRWNHPFHHNIKAWIGRLPDGVLPREPSQEEKWRAEFEEVFRKEGNNISRMDNGNYFCVYVDAAWHGFLAAKKGGAE